MNLLDYVVKNGEEFGPIVTAEQTENLTSAEAYAKLDQKLREAVDAHGHATLSSYEAVVDDEDCLVGRIDTRQASPLPSLETVLREAGYGADRSRTEDGEDNILVFLHGPGGATGTRFECEEFPPTQAVPQLIFALLAALARLGFNGTLSKFQWDKDAKRNKLVIVINVD